MLVSSQQKPLDFMKTSVSCKQKADNPIFSEYAYVFVQFARNSYVNLMESSANYFLWLKCSIALVLQSLCFESRSWYFKNVHLLVTIENQHVVKIHSWALAHRERSAGYIEMWNGAFASWKIVEANKKSYQIYVEILNFYMKNG